MVVARVNKAVPLKRSRKDDPLASVSDEEIARRQAARNAAAREKLLTEFGVLSGVQAAKTVGQWKREGLIFTVYHQGRSVYPAFQFDNEGRPRPVVAEVLATLGQQGRGWQLALWFMSANGWLGGRRPVDVLDTDPAAISEAARREAFDLVF
ncbi:MAG: hypothetical protein QOF89_3968 [Acidobacteriota bacterium]|jgi:hypothetical protein|nr:hypothetical protein [Acidobacteriota bacterium]